MGAFELVICGIVTTVACIISYNFGYRDRAKEEIEMWEEVRSTLVDVATELNK